MTSRLEFRIKGLESRLAELQGEKDEQLDKIAAELTELRKDVGEILTLLRDQANDRPA